MSLINDYLNKTQQDTPVEERKKGGDVPPVLKNVRQKHSRQILLPATVGVMLVCFAGVAYIFVHDRLQKSHPTAKFMAPVNLFSPGVSVATPIPASPKDPVVNPADNRAVRKKTTQVASASPTISDQPATAQQSEKTSEDMSSSPVDTMGGQTDSQAKASDRDSAGPPPEPLTMFAQAPPILIAPLKKEEPLSVVDVDVNHYYQLALIAQKEGNMQEAVRFYREILKKEPAHREALTNLAAAFIYQKQFSDAEKVLTKLLRFDPNNAKALVNLGIISLSSDHEDQARAYFEKALNINPREETALTNLAYLAQKKDDTPSLETYYRKILDLSPDNHEIMLSYASLLEKSERFQEAVTWYRKSLELLDVEENDQLCRRIRERINLLSYYGREK